jgi:transcriptional regulator with XRE-family HTH domain
LTNGRSTTPPPPDAPFGALVSHLRRRKEYTGAKLGKLLGWSQPKISKIETGAVIPSPKDVERLVQVLAVSTEEAARLRDRAEQSRDQMTDWRVGGRHGPAVWQQDIGRIENEARELRVFQPALLSGLLQTSENARAILTDIQETWPASGNAASIAAAVSGRMRRQEILEDRSKSFYFVMPEMVLRWLLSRGVDMTAQLDRIKAVAGQDNVDLRILTDDTRWPLPPTNGFSLLDDRYAVIDLFNTIVVARGETDLRLYRQVFEAISAVATTDIEPTLEKYRRLYLEREAAR